MHKITTRITKIEIEREIIHTFRAGNLCLGSLTIRSISINRSTLSMIGSKSQTSVVLMAVTADCRLADDIQIEMRSCNKNSSS
jgi:hypothetical protein